MAANIEENIKDLEARADDVMQTVQEIQQKNDTLVLQKGENALEYAVSLLSLLYDHGN